MSYNLEVRVHAISHTLSNLNLVEFSSCLVVTIDFDKIIFTFFSIGSFLTCQLLQKKIIWQNSPRLAKV